MFGLTTIYATNHDKVWPAKLKEPFQAGKDTAWNMKQDNCSIIILISHLGYGADVYAAKLIPDVDLVIGGHSHTFLWSGGNPPAYDRRDGQESIDHVGGE